MTNRQQLEEKIREFKYQFIIGNTVGGDLFQNGKCFATTGEKITREMVQIAELTNQLNILIVEMKGFME